MRKRVSRNKASVDSWLWQAKKNPKSRREMGSGIYLGIYEVVGWTTWNFCNDTAMILHILFEAISWFLNFFSRKRSKEAPDECSGGSHLRVYPLNGRSGFNTLFSQKNITKPFTFQEHAIIHSVFWSEDFCSCCKTLPMVTKLIGICHFLRSISVWLS